MRIVRESNHTTVICRDEPGAGNSILLTDADEDGIYEGAALDLTAGIYEYKYFKNTGFTNGEWEGGNNRIADISSSSLYTFDYWGGYYVDFIVTDGTTALEGAAIEISGPILGKELWMGTTDLFGYAYGIFPDGDYNITVSLTDYDSYTGQFNVSQGDFEHPEIVLDMTSLNSLNSKLSVYPNPSNGVFTVEVAQNSNIRISDLAGKIVYTNENTGSTTIDLSSQAKGIYFMQISNEKQTVTQKLVIK